MTHRSDSGLATLITGAFIGAAVMYLLDPDKGKRRRAVTRDKLRRLASRYADLISVHNRSRRRWVAGGKVCGHSPRLKISGGG